MDIDKRKILDLAIAKLEKDMGKGTVMRLGDIPTQEIDYISTGSILLDNALGIGGFPKGRVIEIYGPESSGKTTVALHAVAEVQKLGGSAVFVDVEHALDPIYAKNLGVITDDLIIAQPVSGEEALEITNKLVNEAPIDIIVIDSVAALVPKVEIEGMMGDSHVGLQARLMSQALRKLTGIIHKRNTIAIFINQLREKVGIIYGNPEVTPGGRALKFYSSVRLDVRKGESLKEGPNIIGNKVKIKIVKNKVAPPFKIAELDMIYGKGFSKSGELLDLATKNDIIQKSGSWYSYDGEKIGQGRENAKIYLENNNEIYEEIKRKIKENK